MTEISYLLLVFGAIAFLAIGWFVNQYITNRKFKDWKTQAEKLEKENNGLTKQLKKEKNLVEQTRQKAEGWKQEFHALTQDSQQLVKEHKTRIAASNEQLNQIRGDLSQSKTQIERLETTKEKLRRELEKLKEKYARDVAAGENWRSERQRLERELKTTTDKLEKTTVISNDYRKKYDKQAEEINNIRVMEREMRGLKAKLKKAEENCTYWEKKHYDTHHELAALKDSVGQIESKYKELEELRKGDEILRNNLLEQVSEFKTKFVTVNNKYRDLVSNNN